MSLRKAGNATFLATVDAQKSKPLKRSRGMMLSALGWQRLQAAKQQSELQDNAGEPYTLEAMIARTGLSRNTLTKVHRRQVFVDRQTLEIYFNAFGLSLQPSDFIRANADQTISKPELQHSPLNLQGPVPLDSLLELLGNR